MADRTAALKAARRSPAARQERRFKGRSSAASRPSTRPVWGCQSSSSARGDNYWPAPDDRRCEPAAGRPRSSLRDRARCRSAPQFAIPQRPLLAPRCTSGDRARGKRHRAAQSPTPRRPRRCSHGVLSGSRPDRVSLHQLQDDARDEMRVRLAWSERVEEAGDPDTDARPGVEE